jgi:peptidylprolyl isomerase
MRTTLTGVSVLCALTSACAASKATAPAPVSAAPLAAAEILDQSPAADWRALDPEHTLYLELPSGRVIVELAPAFAPEHVADIARLARGGFFDGAAVLRVQDNYVAQWGRPEDDASPATDLRSTLPAEFDRPATDLPFAALPDSDVYAPEVGFSDGFPAARDGERAWLAHCYAMVGAARDVSPDSGGGGELYVVIGHAPRHLDRNVTLVGRVVQGVERLSSLPRGTGDLGFYEAAEERAPIRAVRIAADLPEAERTPLEALRTDSATFAALIESRRNRREQWFVRPAGRIDLCNVPLPIRQAGR